LFIYFFLFVPGVAWLSSVRVVKCLVNCLNGRNPYFLLLVYKKKSLVKHLSERKDEVKSVWPW